MNISQALEIVGEELIESHGRSHIPYAMICGPTSIGNCPDPDEGVCISISSEVFGTIASSSNVSFENAIIEVAEALRSTRERRWREESMDPSDQREEV